jgi:putative restriction endonuclease
VVRQRLHHRGFRELVIRACRQCCAICRLRHDELLEAAHVLPDGHPLGEPVVPNGLALCTLHHAAFDRYLIGVTPDLEVRVRLDVLEEIDGPALQHGFQGFQGSRIHVPRAAHLRPNRDFLGPSATIGSGGRAETDQRIRVVPVLGFIISMMGTKRVRRKGRVYI